MTAFACLLTCFQLLALFIYLYFILIHLFMWLCLVLVAEQGILDAAGGMQLPEQGWDLGLLR